MFKHNPMEDVLYVNGNLVLIKAEIRNTVAFLNVVLTEIQE